MFSGCKEGIREDDRTRNCSKSGDLAAIIGLSTRGLFWIATQYGIFRILRISGEKILSHHRSSSDISSDSCCGREYPENGDHNAVRNVRIPGVFWSAERRTDFSEFVDEVLRGLDFVCAYICRQYSHRVAVGRGAPRAFTNIFRAVANVWCCDPVYSVK